MIGNHNLELRLLERELLLAPFVAFNETLHCTYSPLGMLSNARGVPMPSELAGLWLTLVGLAIDNLAFHDRATGAAHVRLTAAARQLVDTTYPEHAVAFARLLD